MTRRLLFTAALLLLLIPTTLFAQIDTAITFYGTIQSANATAIVVNGQIVDIQSAQVNAALVSGATVRITARYAADASLSAISVDAVSPGLIPGIVVFSGEITDMTGNAIRVQGQLIDMTNASISGTLTVGSGSLATVYAVQTAPNTWAALIIVAQDAAATGIQPPQTTPEVSATPEASPTPAVNAPASTPEVSAPAATPELESGEDYTIEGTLEAIGSRAILVDGQRYDISGARREGTLVVGARVRLEVRVVGTQIILEEVKVIDSGASIGDDSGDDSSGRGGDDDGSGRGGDDDGSGDDHSGRGGGGGGDD